MSRPVGKLLKDNWLLVLSGFILIYLIISVFYFYSLLETLNLAGGDAPARDYRFYSTEAQGLTVEGVTVGVSLDSMVDARWLREKELFYSRGEELGMSVTVKIAQNDAGRQVRQISSFIKEGVDALIVVPVNDNALQQVLQEARNAGVRIISYDSLTKGPVDYYVGFDYRQWGKLQARSLVEAIGEGNVVVFLGEQTDYRSKEILRGYREVLDAEPGVEIVATEFLPDWSASEAVSSLKSILTRKKVDGILAPTDSIAGEIVRFLKSEHLPLIPITGGGAEVAAARRILDGEQLMTVFADYRRSVEAALEMAGQDGATDHRTVDITYAGRSIRGVLEPVRTLTADNLSSILFDEEEFYDKKTLGDF